MARDTENTTTYTIPPNYTNAGKIFGMFELRNMIEAGGVAIVTIYPLVISPISLQMKIFVSLAAGLAIVFFFGSGIRGDSITQYLGNVIKYLRRRRKLSYAQIIPESKEEADHANHSKKHSRKAAAKAQKRKSQKGK